MGAVYRDAPAVFQHGGPAQDQLAALPRGDELPAQGLMAVVKTNVSVSSRCRGEADDDVAAERSQPGHDSRASQPLTGTTRSKECARARSSRSRRCP